MGAPAQPILPARAVAAPAQLILPARAVDHVLAAVPARVQHRATVVHPRAVVVLEGSIAAPLKGEHVAPHHSARTNGASQQ